MVDHVDRVRGGVDGDPDHALDDVGRPDRDRAGLVGGAAGQVGGVAGAAVDYRHGVVGAVGDVDGVVGRVRLG